MNLYCATIKLTVISLISSSYSHWKSVSKRHADELRLNVSVLLPKRNGTSPLYVDSFVTTLPFFTQNIGDLASQVMFGSIAISGRQSNVTIEVRVAACL